MHGALGTARRVGAEARYRIAGKNRTAQVRSLGEEEEYDEENIEERFRDHALFVGFAPADQPEVVISVVVGKMAAVGQHRSAHRETSAGRCDVRSHDR